MFTGIIEAVGQIAQIVSQSGDIRLMIHTGKMDMSDVKLGDSIAVNGVCLTVTDLTGTGFWADVSNETVAHTRVNAYQVGERVNLEKALTLATRLGGHLVSGHVDGLGVVKRRSDDARSVRLWVEMPPQLEKYIAEKGSITVDGVSLTVNQIEGGQFVLNIVPHTALETVIETYQPGRKVHLEVDLIARYLERLISVGADDDAKQDIKKESVTKAFLAQHGFLR